MMKQKKKEGSNIRLPYVYAAGSLNLNPQIALSVTLTKRNLPPDGYGLE